MKKTLCALAGMFILLSAQAWAGAPDRVTVDRVGRGLWEAVLTRSTVFASAAIDTVFLDVKDLYQGFSGAAATGAVEVFMYFDNLDSGDSLLCSVFCCPENETLACLSGIASFQVVGGAAATVSWEKATSSPAARYWRVIVTNNQHASQASIDYLLRIQGQAAPN
jgi:hypothetical protein